MRRRCRLDQPIGASTDTECSTSQTRKRPPSCASSTRAATRSPPPAASRTRSPENTRTSQRPPRCETASCGETRAHPFREVRHGAVPRVPCLRARARAWRIAIGETIRPRRNYDISAKEASRAPFSMERKTRPIKKPPSGGFSNVATIRFYAAGRSALLLIFLMTAIRSSCCCELNMRIKDCGRSNGGCVKATGSI